MARTTFSGPVASDNGFIGDIQSAAIEAITPLTDNSGGTPSDTIADTPAAYDETYFANTIASLTAKINAIRAALDES